MNWNEGMLANAVARQPLASQCVVLVDRCTWTGCECDVLAVTKNLRVIDVEIKISRSDFKADRNKDKWWHRYGMRPDGVDPATGRTKYVEPTPTLLPWPNRVWKHYFCMPTEIWTTELLAYLPSPKSGVILATYRNGNVSMRVEKRAMPNPEAKAITAEHAINLAQLANLRMWDAYMERDTAHRETANWREKANQLEKAA